ncbi:MAG TPA: c-type cytochrome [Candidatus Paceibacterota bacterium]
MISLLLVLMLAGVSTPDGKEIFLKSKCDSCHAVSTANITAKLKNKAPDLVNVMTRHKAEWVRGFIRQSETHTPCPVVEKTMDGKKHPVSFKGTKDEEDVLIEWLGKQKK